MKKYVYTVLISLLALNVFAQTTQNKPQPKPATSTTAQKPATASDAADSGIVVTPIPDQTYTTVAFTPKVVVKDGAKLLVENVDYSVTYANNVNVGQALITIIGKGNYSDTKVVNFNILPKTINAVQINPLSEQTYRGGTPITPDVLIKDGTKNLVKEVDYTISYSNNVNVGTATVTITGKGNYRDAKTFTFRISPKSMSGRTTTTVRPATTTQQQPAR
jgi:hypothetical protein